MCYLDNAATTRADEDVIACMEKVLREDYGNPSSKHNKGFDAEKYIRNSAESIARTLKCTPREIVFTSGGTESNNMALIGGALANKRAGMHIIASGFEHASVYNPLLFLESQGFKIDFAPVDKMGHIRLQELVDMVTDETIIVSVMYVNNEVGAVEDIKTISEAVKKKNPKVIFHADCIQAYGKYVINPAKEGIDLLSVSGHKIHGPKGSGFLYIKKGVKVKPIIYGGGQQSDMRSGTENVPAIAGLGVAAEKIYRDHKEKMQHLYDLKIRLIEGIREIEGTTINCVPTANDKEFDREMVYTTAPHVLSVSFKSVKAEPMLHALEERGVYVSSGSACSSNHPGISGTLKAVGVSNDLLDCTLRFSFGMFSKEEDVDHAVEALKELVPVMKRYVRK